MSNNLASTVPASRPPTLGDRLRGIADELRQETDIQIKATSRILGAAAQMAQNHDRLIDEVVEMVEEDLDRMEEGALPQAYTVSQLKKQFKTIKEAKAHFNVKASSWDSLVAKLNEGSGPSPGGRAVEQKTAQDTSVQQRLDAIERELQVLQGTTKLVLELVEQMAKRSS